MPGCLRPAIHLPPGHERVTLPLERAGDIVFVRAAVNGEAAGLFIVDTGASGNLVAKPLARRLRLPWIWEAKSRGVGGASKLPVRGVRSIRVGQADLAGHWVGESDFGRVNRVLGVEVEGALGYSAFYHLPVTIDYRASSLTFHDRDQFQPPAQATEAPLRLMDRHPHVRGGINGKHEGWFLLDTGSSAHLGLQGAFVKQHS